MSDERELLRETVAALVAKHASPAAVRRSASRGDVQKPAVSSPGQISVT